MVTIKTFNLKTATKNVNISIDGTENFDNFSLVFGGEINRNQKVLVVTDSNVDRLYGDKICTMLSDLSDKVCKFVFRAGEQSKTLNTVTDIYGALCDGGFTRSDCVVALGGGVVGDITGFAAATYMRGVDYFQIPTTLLAQIDSSIGGKTGVDLPYGKNLVGAFYQPKAVYIAPQFLTSLPEREIKCGLAEAVKYGYISDPTILSDILNGNLESVTEKCVAVKVGVVSRDEMDKGERMILNFGHTVGHAIEKTMNFVGITHGEAVAIGMVYALKAGIALGITAKGTDGELIELLEKIGLPTKTDVSVLSLARVMTLDKKSAGKEISFIFVERAGKSVIRKITAEEICSLIKETVQ